MKRVFCILLMTGCAAPIASRTGPNPAGIEHTSEAPKATVSETPKKSLYDRLGGLPAIEAVVTDFQHNVVADERINAPFGVADIETLHRRLVEFVCVATGGPCKYTGRDMRSAHENMGVTNLQFDILVGCLVKSLDKFHVPEQEKGEILSALGPLRKDIVEVE